MSGPVQPPLTVETIDGTTSGRPITTIKVTNGDLTVSGNIATIDTSGGGGGGMTSFDLAGDSGATQSIGNGDTLSVLGGTGLASVASATDTVTLNIENTLVSGTTPNYYDALTINAQGQVTAVAAGTAPQAAITLTTTGTSGAATLVGATLNIPQYSGGGGGITWPLEADASTKTAPAYSFSGDTDTGIYNPAADEISITLGDTRLFDFQTDTSSGKFQLRGASPIIECDDASAHLSLRSGGATYGLVEIGNENDDIEIIPAGTGLVAMGTGSADMELALKGNTSSAYLRFQYNANTQLSSYSGIYLNANQGGGGNDLVRLNAQTTSIGKSGTDTQLTTQGTASIVIDTNTGTDSGAITIVDGANGAITINPDGTGTVGLGNFVFDVDQTVSASEDAYVLTYTDSTGEISLKEAGGGGGGGYPVAMPSYADVGDSTYNVLASSPIFGGSYMTAQNVSNSPYHYPFIATTSGTVSAIAINVQSAVVGVNILVGIYDTGTDNLPDSRLGFATISAAATGNIEQTSITGTIALTAGTQYWVAWCKDDNAGTPTCQCTTNSATQSITSLMGLGNKPADDNVQTIYTFDSQELPATFDSSTAYQGTTGRLAVGVKF